MFRDLVPDLNGEFAVPDTFLDVPFVPSEDDVVHAMLRLAGVGPKDLLYDLGCGDGRIVVAAARHYGARAIGVELDPLRIADAMEYAGDEGVECDVDFIEEDLFDVDISKATVVALYLLDSINTQLRPRFLKELRPGARIVSHAFGMGDWQADAQIKVNGITVHKWVVPASVEGSWEWTDARGMPWRVELDQEYQRVTGAGWAGDKETAIEATLSGTTLKIDTKTPDTDESRRFVFDFKTADQPEVSEG